MDAKQTWRLEQLRGPWCSAAFIDELYGLDLPQDNALLGRLRAWSKRFWRRDKDIVRHEHGLEQGESYNRHALETFLQISELVPRRWAAVRLGMDRDSFDKVLHALVGESLLPPDVLDGQIVAESVVRESRRWFPSLAHAAFANHTAYCTRLHAAIEADLSVTVSALRCVTSEALGEDPPDYASDFDAITLEPVGHRYQVWLDFKKPINLKPDCCSLKFFAAEQSALLPYVMRGDEPERIPAALRSRAG